MILGLDLATNVGWCAGPRGAIPQWGSHTLPKTGAEVGPFLLAYRVWAGALIERTRPKLIVFEKPVLGQMAGGGAGGKLIGLANETEVLAYQYKIQCSCIHNGTLKKAFAGSGKATKDDMVAKARAMGFHVKTHDEADACAVWWFAVTAGGKRAFEPVAVAA